MEMLKVGKVNGNVKVGKFISIGVSKLHVYLSVKRPLVQIKDPEYHMPMTDLFFYASDKTPYDTIYVGEWICFAL